MTLAGRPSAGRRSRYHRRHRLQQSRLSPHPLRRGKLRSLCRDRRRAELMMSVCAFGARGAAAPSTPLGGHPQTPVFCNLGAGLKRRDVLSPRPHGEQVRMRGSGIRKRQRKRPPLTPLTTMGRGRSESSRSPHKSNKTGWAREGVPSRLGPGAKAPSRRRREPLRAIKPSNPHTPARARARCAAWRARRAQKWSAAGSRRASAG
jgi:hypothetical protein